MRSILSALLLLLAAGCTSGRDFVRPGADVLSLGQMTRADILARYGRPERQLTRVVAAPESGAGLADPASAMCDFTSLFYTYEDLAEAGWNGGAARQKQIKFDFANGRLFSYTFLSNFDADSSNFDERRIALLENGITTKDEVLALFGAPSGRTIFPGASPGDEKYVYQYIEKTRRERLMKRLELIFDDDDVLRDFSYASDFGPLPRSGEAENAPAPLLLPDEK
jgi:hypothetical protein